MNEKAGATAAEDVVGLVDCDGEITAGVHHSAGLAPLHEESGDTRVQSQEHVGNADKRRRVEEQLERLETESLQVRTQKNMPRDEVQRRMVNIYSRRKRLREKLRLESMNEDVRIFRVQNRLLREENASFEQLLQAASQQIQRAQNETTIREPRELFPGAQGRAQLDARAWLLAAQRNATQPHTSTPFGGRFPPLMPNSNNFLGRGESLSSMQGVIPPGQHIYVAQPSRTINFAGANAYMSLQHCVPFNSNSTQQIQLPLSMRRVLAAQHQATTGFSQSNATDLLDQLSRRRQALNDQANAEMQQGYARFKEDEH
jgi:hypothetical protein